MALSSAIHFYSVSDEYGAFSNFAPYPITLGKKHWPTSEHYFQAQKFLDPKDQELVRSARTASLAAREGRDRSKRLRRDWEAVKVSVMRQAVEAKVTQHADLATLLLSTGNSDIFEHTDDDSYWGDGGDGSGRNMLGRILMEVRQSLRVRAVAPETELSTVLVVMARAWEEGCPVASPSEHLANVALRRFHSSERRGVSLDDRDARVRDLAVGLVEQSETLPVGPLKLDYEYLAGLIVDALRTNDSR